MARDWRDLRNRRSPRAIDATALAFGSDRASNHRDCATLYAPGYSSLGRLGSWSRGGIPCAYSLARRPLSRWPLVIHANAATLGAARHGAAFSFGCSRSFELRRREFQREYLFKDLGPGEKTDPLAREHDIFALSVPNAIVVRLCGNIAVADHDLVRTAISFRRGAVHGFRVVLCV